MSSWLVLVHICLLTWINDADWLGELMKTRSPWWGPFCDLPRRTSYRWTCQKTGWWGWFMEALSTFYTLSTTALLRHNIAIVYILIYILIYPHRCIWLQDTLVKWLCYFTLIDYPYARRKCGLKHTHTHKHTHWVWLYFHRLVTGLVVLMPCFGVRSGPPQQLTTISRATLHTAGKWTLKGNEALRE